MADILQMTFQMKMSTLMNAPCTDSGNIHKVGD